jgi:uncharacterized protein (DUF305 family)
MILKYQPSVTTAVLALAACSQPEAAKAPESTAPASAAGGHHSDANSDHMAMLEPAPADTPATRGYKESMATMMRTMPAYTQDADIDFNKQMKVHHQAAIDMAEAQLAHGKDAASRTLAEEIIAAQRKEIAQIDAWLRQRGQ